MSEETRPASRWVPAMLVIVPLGIAAFSGIGMWQKVKHDKTADEREALRFSKVIDRKTLADDLHKWVNVIGERNVAAAPDAMKRGAAMIAGMLGPSNCGYKVQQEAGPPIDTISWPMLRADLPGRDAGLPAIWVIANYDSRRGSKGAEANATGVCAVTAAAQALAGDHPQRSVRFVFLPHGSEADAPLAEQAQRLQRWIASSGGAYKVLVVEAMAGGDALLLTAAQAAAMPEPATFQGLARALNAQEVSAGALSQSLAAANLPVVRVATRAPLTAQTADDSLPSADTLTLSSGRLVEWLRRLAR